MVLNRAETTITTACFFFDKTGYSAFLPLTPTLPVSHSPRSLRNGFTLIELLTVIAIIGVLAALLLVVLPKVRDSAKIAKCISNERQIAIGHITFATENRGFYVYNGFTGSGINWPEILRNGGYLGERSSSLTNKEKRDLKGVFFCPSEEQTLNTNTADYTYTLSSPHKVNMASVKEPSQRVMLDEARATNGSGLWEAAMNSRVDFDYKKTPWAVIPNEQFRHGGNKKVLSFFDGRAKVYTKADLNPPEVRAKLFTNPTANVDLQWW